jgi:hypothetical protein
MARVCRSASGAVGTTRGILILEDIAANSPNEGYRMTAIRDLWDRAHGRPTQAIEGTGPSRAIPFQVVLPVVISNDDD